MSCLRMARYLAPLDWTIAYNMGLVQLRDKRYANAFHSLHAANVLAPTQALPYMYVAVCLHKLGDHDNAKLFFIKSLLLDK